MYLGVKDKQLRYYNSAGELVATPEEEAQQERKKAEQERVRAQLEQEKAEQERARAEKLAAQLRALGIEPDI